MADLPVDPSAEGDLFARLEAGELDRDEQLELAAALRRDPGLRQRLRQRLAISALLVQAASAVPVSSASSRGAVPSRSTPLLPYFLAAAALIVLAVGALVLAVVLSPGEPAAPPPSEVASSGPFSLDEQRGALRLPDHSQVDLEAGSSGTVSHPQPAQPVVRLDGGGANLRVAPDAQAVLVQTGPANITVRGQATVQYLDVPEGALPAVDVKVATGSAQVDTGGGQPQALGVGDTRLVIPGGQLKAKVVRIDAQKGLIQLSAGTDRRSWTISTAVDAPPVTASGQPLPISALEAEWRVVLQVEGNGSRIARIEVPPQTREGTISAWDPVRRTVEFRRSSRHAPETLRMADGLPLPDLQPGQVIRVTVDPRSKQVIACTPVVRRSAGPAGNAKESRKAENRGPAP
jgi:hypothetical protein